MGYVLPNTDQGCLRQPCPREMWAVGWGVLSARIWGQVQEAPEVLYHWIFLRRKKGNLEFQRHETIDS